MKLQRLAGNLCRKILLLLHWYPSATLQTQRHAAILDQMKSGRLNKKQVEETHNVLIEAKE